MRANLTGCMSAQPIFAEGWSGLWPRRRSASEASSDDIIRPGSGNGRLPLFPAGNQNSPTKTPLTHQTIVNQTESAAVITPTHRACDDRISGADPEDRGMISPPYPPPVNGRGRWLGGNGAESTIFQINCMFNTIHVFESRSVPGGGNRCWAPPVRMPGASFQRSAADSAAPAQGQRQVRRQIAHRVGIVESQSGSARRHPPYTHDKVMWRSSCWDIGDHHPMT